MKGRLYDPMRLVQIVKDAGLTKDVKDMLPVYEYAIEIERETAAWWDEDEGFGSSDIFGDVVELARYLGYKYNHPVRGWEKIA